MTVPKIITAFSPKNIIRMIRGIPGALLGLVQFLLFFILLVSFLLTRIIALTARIPLLGRVFRRAGTTLTNSGAKKLGDRAVQLLEKSRASEVKSSYLINLAFKNLLAKKTRTIVTVSGMSFGVGIIVLLLSLGYGVEKLVISKVASLDELRIIDVTAGENTTLRLDGALIKKIRAIKEVENAVPVISVVGKVTYNRATTDIIVYAASSNYMDFSRLRIIQGEPLARVEARDTANSGGGQVAGTEDHLISGTYGVPITGDSVSFNVNPGSPLVVRENCSISSDLLGYTLRSEGGSYQGVEYWGSTYFPHEGLGRAGYDEDSDQDLGKWVRGSVPLYKKLLTDDVQPVIDDFGRQVWKDGCLQAENISVTPPLKFGTVLAAATGSGEATQEAVGTLADVDASSSSLFATLISGSGSGGLEVVEIATSSGNPKVTTAALDFTSPPSGHALVSQGTLSLLNIPLKSAIGTKFKVAFIVTKNLKPDINGRAITKEMEYEIKGVTDDTESTYMFIPITDMESLGVANFSQIKVLLKNKEALPEVRKQIETYGFRTGSTVDTVQQIEGLFANLRVILGLMGMVALGIASLGMFNTLTVSLLEKTREIGGMKTMGMVSSEIQDLFLAEAMIIGLCGGVGGLLVGTLTGHLISFIVSAFAAASGQGYLALTDVPLFLSAAIVVLSFVIGFLTGLYPAQRARGISALNALRYE